MLELEALLDRAASAIVAADALLITAGAGMGVDSGLPDFRGPEGFWKAYPPFRELGLDFAAAANPRWFVQDPSFAWGFYGHRLNLYRNTAPHEGFQILRRWSEQMSRGAFVFTSNVDGHFLRSGFPAERIHEVHGSILHAQCLDDCGAGIFSAEALQVTINAATFRGEGDLPACPKCGGLARPNVLMFGDDGWDPARCYGQEAAFQEWFLPLGSNLVVIELGAGTAIPTVRIFSEQAAAHAGAFLVRINLRDPEIPPSRGGSSGKPSDERAIGLPMGALAALRAIDERLPTSFHSVVAGPTMFH